MYRKLLIPVLTLLMVTVGTGVVFATDGPGSYSSGQVVATSDVTSANALDRVPNVFQNSQYLIESYNRRNGETYGGLQRIRITLEGQQDKQICRTNSGFNLLGVFLFDGEPFAVAERDNQPGIVLISPKVAQLQAGPGGDDGGQRFCEETTANDANDADYSTGLSGEFVVSQGFGNVGERIVLNFNGAFYARTNGNEGNGNALRLQVFTPSDPYREIPVVFSDWQNPGFDDRWGCTLHVPKDSVIGNTDISLDARVANNLEDSQFSRVRDLCTEDRIG